MKNELSGNNGYNKELVDNRFKTIEDKVDDLRTRVDDLSKINSVLIELKHLSEQQGKMIERLFTTQSKQNETLSNISDTTNQLGFRITNTEETIEDLNEKVCREKEKGTIYISELARNAILVVLGAVFAALVAKVI